jgi:hypothetical protein
MIAQGYEIPGSAVWQRVVHLRDQLSPTAARALLKVGFDERDAKQLAELAAKARAGQLTKDEEREADAYERLGCLLDVIHSQARRVLKRRKAS